MKKTNESLLAPDDQSAGSSDTQPEFVQMTVDAVRKVKDPKAGFFGSGLLNAYPAGEDTPDVFCDSGPSIPTGKLVTVFFTQVASKPESTACKKVVAVLDGAAIWYEGRPVTIQELTRMKEQEERFEVETGAYSSGQMSFAWRNPKPVGKPCPSDGPVQDVKFHSRGRQCSIALVYKTGYMVFLNWKVAGSDAGGVDAAGSSPTGNAVLKNIEAKYGSKYVVMK